MGRGPGPVHQPPAVLAVVICAIALSLAYPVASTSPSAEIDQLQAERQMLNGQLHALQHQQQRLTDPVYVEQLARNELHMCLRGETCYIVIGGQTARPGSAATLTPWYERLWQSVQEANRGSQR
jgi:cell division protein FtsB